MALKQERASVLATAGLLGIGVNVAALILAPVLRPDIHLLRDGLSRYAVGPWGEVQSVGFIAQAISSLTVAGSLWLVANGNRWTRIAAITLGLASLSLVGLVAFPMGQSGPLTPIGDLHLTVGTLAVGWQFVSVAALLLGLKACNHAKQIIQLGIVLLGISLLGAASVQVAMLRPDLKIPLGVTMRMVIVPLLLWWALVALNIRQRAAS